LFSGVTELGSVWASLAAASLLAARREREAAARALAAALTTWSLGQGLKRMFGRERPYDALPERVRLLIARPQGTSWPSNHPATLLAFVTVAAAELDLGVPERAALYALAGCVGASRVYLGVHFPSDVVGGMLLAGAVAAASSRRDRRPPLQ
jgi:undecaprenyl-diphosphatase